MTVLMVRAKAGADSDKVEAVLEQLDEKEFEAFFNAWNEHSGVGVGE